MTLGGAVGAGARHLLAGPAAERCGVAVWLAIMLVNVLGCLLVGIVFGWTGSVLFKASPVVSALLIAGFAGGFTTFSTAMLDAWVLWRRGAVVLSLACLLLTPVVGVVALLFGAALVGGSS